MYVLTDDIDQITLPADLNDRGSMLTIGTFDGIHLGHQYLISRLVTHAKRGGYLSGLVTFHPHPSAVLSPQHTPLYLTTAEEKAILLEKLGLDWAVILAFKSELAAISPRDFARCLYRRLNMRGLWVGDDFAFGRNREGNVETLQALGSEMGFQVQVIPVVNNGGQKISSSRIRALLWDGDVLEAARLLGRRYRLSGRVVRGARRGRRLGFPTANIDVPPDRVVPAHGIYATYACLGSQRYESVTNIGVRPSFDSGARTIEAHLLGFDRDIYGHDLVIDFVARLRPEHRFHDVKELIAQIDQDIVEAREILGTAAEQQFSFEPGQNLWEVGS
jgi:riboflavin kinase/FMN adenylyltransferase